MAAVSLAELGKHKTADDAWILINGIVYDVSSFLSLHPGGKKILLLACGGDASAKFEQFHKPGTLQQWAPKFRTVGPIESSSKPEIKPTTSKSRKNEFGAMMPYGDPAHYQGWNSPYYKETHFKFRQRARDFVEKEIIPFVSEWDDVGKVLPKEVFKKAYQAGLLPAVIGPPWPKEYVDSSMAPEAFDAFHELILVDEITRCGSGGVVWGLIGGLSIGLPPIMKFGSEYLKGKVVADCLKGEKFICLCISEPQTASDVAGLFTTARREGDYYIVNGEKKWITNGMFADYFTVAVRTGTPESKGAGLSLLLLEKDMPGLSVRHMKCMGVWPSATTYVTFEDVKVPVKNLIGKENEGFKYIMHNFNHERWSIVVEANRCARLCLEEAFRYSMERETFGKRLIEHQMIRWKLGEMARQVEATHAWLEQVTYQFTTMSHEESNVLLGGPIALLKVQSTKTFEFCAREAAQIFGGASYVRGGVGEKIERLYREVRAFAIPGGSEEIMLDFGVRQAQRNAAKRMTKL